MNAGCDDGIVWCWGLFGGLELFLWCSGVFGRDALCSDIFPGHSLGDGGGDWSSFVVEPPLINQTNIIAF